MVLEISSALLARLLNEAEKTPDREVCGLLFGTAARIEAIEVCDNVAVDPRRHFEIDPAALFAAIRAERAGGPALLGYWHSHPGGDVEPSARDLEGASDDGKIWLVVAGDDVAAWRVQISEIFVYGGDANREWTDEFGWIARPTSNGQSSKRFIHVPLATGQIRHLVPRDKCDEDLVPLIAKAGYPAIAPILDDLLPWIADPNWPVAPPLIEYLRTLGPIMVEPIRRQLSDPASDAKEACLLFLVAELAREVQATLVEEMRALATASSDKDRYYEADVAAREILERLESIGR